MVVATWRSARLAAITVPIYASNTPDEVTYILQHSGSVLLFVDHDQNDGKQPGRFTRARSVLRRLPRGASRSSLFEGRRSGDRECRWRSSSPRARRRPSRIPRELRGADRRALQVDDACDFIYTSGTTGDPKGVMLTHGNWAYEAKALADHRLMRARRRGDAVPAAGARFAQVVKAAWLGIGLPLIFAESVDKLLREPRARPQPTILPAVPRVFEKVYNAWSPTARPRPGVKGKLFRWAFGSSTSTSRRAAQGREYDSLWLDAGQEAGRSARCKATLDEKLGGKHAPLHLRRRAAVAEDRLLLRPAGFQILEGYGLTETSAGTPVNRPEQDARSAPSGRRCPGTEVKIAADGEILIRGPGVMKGYYNKPDGDRARSSTPDGWFHTGDIGEIDADGFLRITDRKKDIIVTAGGKNVAPQNLENTLKTVPDHQPGHGATATSARTWPR